AEYSFAFKVFEVATLPLLVVAPILIPRFTKLFHSPEIPDTHKVNDLFVLLRFEIIIASLVALMLNILWVPVIDFITHGKYGMVNSYTILILSACMPFLYINNFLWTFHFVKGRLKMIFYIFFITFLVNIIGDIILIPFFGGEGAAVAYLSAIIIQFILFWQKTVFPEITKNAAKLLICPVTAFASGALSIFLFSNLWLIAIFSLFFFFSCLILMRIVRLQDLTILRRVTGI
ncbi:MAG: lipopolysaccharide biosynthesis protein, partial [Ginsengibacter sp.]